MRRLKYVAVALVILLAAAQFVRPERKNPVTDPDRTITAHIGTASGLVAILDRSCGTCHSNETVWPSYSQVAPLSWLMARAVAEGRQAVNFSEWGTYSPDQQQALLAASCDDVSTGRMPGLWTWLDQSAQLSPQDIETICAASHPISARATGVSP